ncbi:MAG: helix-turn-helix domain-containing protein [Bacteroidaceae bacterium]|nr:helix-turn-helix domain-containing protein [Bacteroidaceae bacterium]
MNPLRILAAIACFTVTVADLRAADSVDSLYRILCTQARTEVNTANQLLLLLDAEGVTDSLVHFDARTPREEVLACVHLNMAAHYYEQATNMMNTLLAARRAEAAAREVRDTAVMTEALAYQAVAASRMGHLDVALTATREELRLDSLSSDLPNQSRAYNTLAGLSLQAGRIDDAKLFIYRAIQMERQLPDSGHLSVRYGVAAEIFAKAGELQQALHYAQRAYELDRAEGNEVKTARRLAQMADIYDAMGDFKAAETFYLRSIAALREAGEQKSLAINLKQLGQSYLRQQRLSEARTALEECEDICRKTDNRYTLQQVCRLLAEAYGKSQPEKAVTYLQEALALTDTLHSQRAEQLAAQMRAEELKQLSEEPSDLLAHPASRISWLTVLIVIVLLMAATSAVLLWRRNKTKRSLQMEQESGSPTAETPDADTKGAEMPTDVKSHAVPNESAANLAFLAKVSELYDQNLERHRLSIDELASEMCMSRSQFTRRINAATGTSASNYFNRLRMEKAQRLLKDTERPISTIAYECGFDDTSYFCNLFKKLFKVTPMQYRLMPNK